MTLIFVGLSVVPANRIRFVGAQSLVTFVYPGPALFQVHFGHLFLGLLSERKNETRLGSHVGRREINVKKKNDLRDTLRPTSF